MQIHPLSTPKWSILLSWEEAASLFTAMQLVIQHRTSLGQKMAVQQCCIMARHTPLLTYRGRLLEITHVQLGMEWAKRPMLPLQLLYNVSGLLPCSYPVTLDRLGERQQDWWEDIGTVWLVQGMHADCSQCASSDFPTTIF